MNDSSVQIFDVRFDSGEDDFNVDFDATDDFDSGFDDVDVVEVKDHRALSHRDAPQQHPIDSITELTDELAVRPDEALSNWDIDIIINASDL